MSAPVRFVLVHPRTPENLGAAARALKNFGQTEWTWVRPPWSPDDARARTLAVGAEDVLASARLAPTLEEAVADCSWVVGTDADLRRLEGMLEDLLRTARFVRPGRSGVAPLVDPWRRSGLTRAEIRLWESAIRMLARSLSKSSADRDLKAHQNS